MAGHDLRQRPVYELGPGATIGVRLLGAEPGKERVHVDDLAKRNARPVDVQRLLVLAQAETSGLCGVDDRRRDEVHVRVPTGQRLASWLRGQRASSSLSYQFGRCG